MELVSGVFVYKPSQVLSLLLSILWCVLTGKISANTSFSPWYLYTDLSWSSIHSHPQWGPGRGRKTPRGPMSVWGLHRGRGWSGEVLPANHQRAHGPGHAPHFALTWPAGVNPARPGWTWHAVAGRVYWNSVSRRKTLETQPISSPGPCKQLHAATVLLLWSYRLRGFTGAVFSHTSVFSHYTNDVLHSVAFCSVVTQWNITVLSTSWITTQMVVLLLHRYPFK